MPLIVKGPFTSKNGKEFRHKVECDALRNDDLDGIAFAIGAKLPPFGAVLPVPRGGLLMGVALQPYLTRGCPTVLVVDDVLTTGRSMEEVRDADAAKYDKSLNDYVGFVVVARGPVPDWVWPFWIQPAWVDGPPGLSPRLTG